jgi:hypothetical protein
MSEAPLHRGIDRGDGPPLADAVRRSLAEATTATRLRMLPKVHTLEGREGDGPG